MPEFSPEITSFIIELDAAVEAHMDWTRRVMRCAVLKTPPGDDVMSPLAHTLCRFGRWFKDNYPHFFKIDDYAAQRINQIHQSMHDAIRMICTGILSSEPVDAHWLDDFEQTQSELITLLANFKTALLAHAARYDPLTGLPLRYGLEDEFAQMQRLVKRNRSQLYLVLIDVDHFKRINDNYGHAFGDKALCHLADTLKHVVRPNEPIYRFGGEEFLWLVQAHNQQEVICGIERIMLALQERPIPLNKDNQVIHLAVTLGIADVEITETMVNAIERADAALYVGKQTGCNRYVFATPHQHSYGHYN